jgi:hypothetical protein
MSTEDEAGEECWHCGAAGLFHMSDCPMTKIGAPEPTPPVDNVNHPQHYGGDTVYETIKVIEAWDLSFNLGNAVKYISRAGRKKETCRIEDLKKAAWYLNREIERTICG